MHFLLARLKVVYVLITPKPVVNENETLAEGCARLKWEQDDYICKGHICNSMSDNLLDLYQNMATTKEGLLYGGDDTLFESTGLYGESSVRKVSLRTGKVEALQKMDSSYFGEGLTLLGERLFQVTWLQKTGFIYDRNNLSKFENFKHHMKDGWGLATDGNILFGSDGTSTLYHIDSRTLKVLRKQIVKYKGHEVHNLNELEFVNGEVLANVWQTDCIARISVKDGGVLGWILLPNLREGLVAAGENGIDVLNGIAWDVKQKRLFVTGKLWPKIYEIKLHPMTKPLSGSIEQLCMPQPFNFWH